MTGLRQETAWYFLVAALLLAILLRGMQVGGTFRGQQRHRVDSVTQAERRLRPVREVLHGERMVGYVAAAVPGQDRDESKRLNLAQYVLAPTLLVTDPTMQDLRFDRYLINLRYPEDLDPFLREHPFTLVQDFGGGVAVVERKDR